MRIRCRNRRGSIGLEAIMLVPVATMMIFVARYVSEATVSRQEIAVHLRSATENAAGASAAFVGQRARPAVMANCRADKTAFFDNANVAQSGQASCVLHYAERDVPRKDRFWVRADDGAQPWPAINRDFAPIIHIYDVKSKVINGSMRFRGSNFLQRQGEVEIFHQYITPRMNVWDHKKAPLKKASDPQIWKELKRRPTYKLFPNVFPGK